MKDNHLMTDRLLLTFVTALLAGGTMSGQHLVFPTDAIQRGYYDRPYLRYEAEPDLCKSWQGEMLLPPEVYSQKPLQAEASRQCALTLGDMSDYVEWTADGEADGLTIRFSLPDSADGKGQRSTLLVMAGDEKLGELNLDSYWAWQYTPIAWQNEKYPDNTPADNKFARMRFDETSLVLTRPVHAGETFRLVKKSDDGISCTVDFVELEKVPAPVTFDRIEGDKVIFDPEAGTLQNLINSNPGKTIYIPAGEYNIPRRVMITVNDTKVVGAGMWYTRLYFSAAPDQRGTYSQRGFESNCSGLTFEGFSMNTANNCRYFNNNPSMQVGKGFNGSLGSGSVIRDVKIEHFECGAWIADYGGTASRGLLVENCRIRNNYADGINLSSGTCSAIVRHCSFRNNGDDDMASWSQPHQTADNVYEFNTAENNWRASSLGFFGGKSNIARDLYICDAMEEGLRINSDFEHTGYAPDGQMEVRRITIERCGDCAGTSGEHGGFWGAACPSLHIGGGYFADVVNVLLSDIEIKDSRWRGLNVSCNSGKSVKNLMLRNIHVDGVAGYEWAIYVDPSARGYGDYDNLTWENCVEPAFGNGSTNFTLTENPGAGIEDVSVDNKMTVVGRELNFEGLPSSSQINVHSVEGLHVASASAGQNGGVNIKLENSGIYIVSFCNNSKLVFVR